MADSPDFAEGDDISHETNDGGTPEPHSSSRPPKFRRIDSNVASVPESPSKSKETSGNSGGLLLNSYNFLSTSYTNVGELEQSIPPNQQTENSPGASEPVSPVSTLGQANVSASATTLNLLGLERGRRVATIPVVFHGKNNEVVAEAEFNIEDDEDGVDADVDMEEGSDEQYYESNVYAVGGDVCMEKGSSQEEYASKVEVRTSGNEEASTAQILENLRTCDSPCSSGSSVSSQSSMTSGEYLFKLTCAIQNRSSDHWVEVLSKEKQKLLEGYLKDPLSSGRLKKFLLADMRSHFLASSLSLDHGSPSGELLKSLENEDENTVLARIGRILMENYRRSKSKMSSGSTDEGPSADVQNTGVTGNDEVEETAALFDYREEVHSTVDNKPDANVKQEVVAGKSTGSNVADEVRRQSAMDAEEVTSEERKIFNVGQRDFERIFDCIRNLTDNKKRIVKAGQQLFQCVFTTSDILECSQGAKKDKKHFDSDKTRFINRAVAWLLENPPIRSVQAFEESATQDKRLSREDEAILLKSVFVEFASQQRKKMEKAMQILPH